MKGILVSFVDENGYRQFAVEYHGYQYPLGLTDVLSCNIKLGDTITAGTLYDPESKTFVAVIESPQPVRGPRSKER